MNRRDFFANSIAGVATAKLVTSQVAFAQAAAPAPAPTGPFTLPPLGYAVDALEPFIDAQTMTIHHDRHHKAYVDNLNKAVAAQPDLGKESVESLVSKLSSLPDSVRTAVRNQGGGHANHSLYWKLLKKNNGEGPKGALAKAIDGKFGSFSAFQDQFTKAAMGVFGSGWAWLTLEGKTLMIEATPNQDSVLTAGNKPVMGIDVWEHAYYLKYQNKRADYVAAFQKVIDWDFVSGRYDELLG